MIGLVPLHRAGEIRSGVILSTAGDYCVTENFPAALPNFLAFSVAPRPSMRRSTFNSSSGLISAIGFANVREHIFVESLRMSEAYPADHF